MKKIYCYLLLLVALMFAACSSEDIDLVKEAEDNVILKSENLDDRIHFDNAGVVGTKNMQEMPENFYSSTKTYSVKMGPDPVSDLAIILVAELDAPEYGDITLQATHVCFNGDYAYISYNVRGAKHLGAVEVVDISTPGFPQLAMQAIFPTTDISSLVYKNGILYMVGARDINTDDTLLNTAVLLKMTLDGDMLSDEIEYVELVSYAGTDVAAGDDYLYCVSGSNGNLDVFEYGGGLSSSLGMADLRAVGIDGDKLVVFSGTEGLHVYDISSLSETLSIDIADQVDEAKRTIDFYDDHVLVAEGFDGMGAYDLTTGDLKLNIPMTTVSDDTIDPNDLVCNSVAETNDHIFMSEGAAGVYVYSLVDSGLDEPEALGGLRLEGSANYLESDGEYIFVADGTGGLKILRIYTSDQYTCSSYESYTGGSWLSVGTDDDQAYSGSATLGGVNINAQLIWCGSLAVSDKVQVNSGGEFVMIGSLVAGSNSGTALEVDDLMVVDGSVTIYGDLVVNDGASIEFMGSDSSLAVTGTVTTNGTGEIKGSYTVITIP